MSCYICYEEFTKDNCNCTKCIEFNDKTVPIITDKNILNHNFRKKCYNFVCGTCNAEICMICHKNIKHHSRKTIINCPLCRDSGMKDYFKVNVLRDINTLGLHNNDPKLLKLNKYSSTWKDGYWNDIGIPLIKKVLGVKTTF